MKALTSRMTWIRSCIAACVPVCLRAPQECPADAQDESFSAAKPPSPTPVMEPVLSLTCRGVVKGHERNVFVAIKSELHRCNVRVTQLARPSDVLLMFHDITDDVDVDEILRKVSMASAESGAQEAVLVLMYRDFEDSSLAGFQSSGHQLLGDMAWRKLEGAVSLLVDMVFEEEVEAGVSDCLQNAYSLHHVVQYLKGVVRHQNAMLTGDSFTISRAISQQATPVTPPTRPGMPSLYSAPSSRALDALERTESSGSRLRATIPGRAVRTRVQSGLCSSSRCMHAASPSSGSQQGSLSPVAPSSLSGSTPLASPHTPSCPSDSMKSRRSKTGSSNEAVSLHEPVQLPQKAISQKGSVRSRSGKSSKKQRGGRQHHKRAGGRKARDEPWKRNLTWGGWEYQSRSMRSTRGGKENEKEKEREKEREKEIKGHKQGNPPLAPLTPGRHLVNDEIKAVVDRSPGEMYEESSVYSQSCGPSKEIASAYSERERGPWAGKVSSVFDGNLFLEFVPE